MVVEGGRSLTAGAALSHLDLVLRLVGDQSPALAAIVARYLVLDPRPSPASYAIPAHVARADDLVAAFDTWVRQRLDEPVVVGHAARAIGTTERTLARRTQRTLGKSPLAHVLDLRVERAVHLLRTSDASIEEIAAAVGYGDGVTLRTLLRRKTGRGVRELRAGASFVAAQAASDGRR